MEDKEACLINSNLSYSILFALYPTKGFKLLEKGHPDNKGQISSEVNSAFEHLLPPSISTSWFNDSSTFDNVSHSPRGFYNPTAQIPAASLFKSDGNSYPRSIHLVEAFHRSNKHFENNLFFLNLSVS